MEIRRVIIGHDRDGKAVVEQDGLMTNVKVMPSGHSGCVMWATEGTPADPNVTDDPAARDRDLPPPRNGTVLRILELVPHKPAFMHRTDSVDYCIVLQGECVMKMDDEKEVTLRQGDILIQKGTWHGWENRSGNTCRLAFVLIDGKAPTRTLHPTLGH
jgi:quercetin dioxygenase-like cupin family protein